MGRHCSIAVLVLFLFATISMPALAQPGAAGPTAPGAAACAADPWIDVRCYGATGNGSTDDTGAVNRALAAAMAADEPLFLPHGTFRLTRTLVIASVPPEQSISNTGCPLIDLPSSTAPIEIRRKPVSARLW